MTKKTVIVTTTLALRVPPVPDYIMLDEPGVVPAPMAGTDGPGRVPVKGMTEEMLDILAFAWVAALYEKAGKPAPAKPALAKSGY